MSDLMAQMDASAGMEKFLAEYGLSALKDRLWRYVTDNGVDDENRLFLWMAEQPEYKARFPAMDALSKKGRAITPAQYIQLERSYAQVMRENGVPTSFFDKNEDFAALIANEVSPNELQARVQDGYAKVANADPKVREQFTRYFGVNGDTALATFFMDPERALPKLEQAAASAEIAGAASRLNFTVGLNEASRLAQMGVSYDKAMEGFQRMNQTRDLFESSVGDTAVTVESATQSQIATFGTTAAQQGAGIAGAPSDLRDLATDEDTKLAIAYTFGTDGEAQRDLARRLDERRAAVGAEVQRDNINKQGDGALGAAG